MASAPATAGRLGAVGGRKRRQDLWTYFQYNPAERKTECLVSTEGEDGVSRLVSALLIKANEFRLVWQVMNETSMDSWSGS